MIAYFKKFGATLIGSFLLGIMLTIFAGIPWRFIVTLAIFLFILNTIIEQSSSHGAVTGALKKLTLFAAGIIIFVGLRGVTGYFLDMPAGQVLQDLTSTHPNTSRLATNMVFELLFLAPGIAIAYMVVREGRFWKTVLVVTCIMLSCWMAWTIKQRAHAEAMKRQSQALVSLNARRLNNKALISEAAAAMSFGVAKAKVSLFYQQSGTNGFILDQSLRNWSLLPGAKVKQLHPDALPVVFEGEAFTQVVMPNTNGSFVGGTKTWVESWKFNWVDGRNNIIAPTSSASTEPKFEAMPAGTHLIRVTPKQETNWKVIPKDLYWSLSARGDGGDWQLKPFNGRSVQYKNGQSQLTDITGLGNTIKLVNDGDKELEFDLVVKP